MIVSFDLDDTLFVSEKDFKTEPTLHFPMNVVYREKLRLGTVELMRYIRDQNIQLWIYTNSDRSERYKYHIDLHIDDEAAIAQNGKDYGFHVFIVREQDDEWTEKVKKEIERIKKMLSLCTADVKPMYPAARVASIFRFRMDCSDITRRSSSSKYSSFYMPSFCR